jgi:hypothetical protein
MNLEVKLLRELTRIRENFHASKTLRTLRIPKGLDSSYIYRGSRSNILKRGETDNRITVLTTNILTGYESNFWKTSVKRHLTSLESRTNSAACSSSLTLTTLT